MPAGYEICEEDRQNIHSKDLCGICSNVLKTAIQAECGHRYCLECLEEEFNKHNGEIKCKICDEVLTREKIFRDKFADREIQALILYCINCIIGCKWRGHLKDRQEHQNTCKFIPLPCVNRGCEKKVTKEALPHHLQNECLFREVLCSYCEQPVIYSKIKEHEDFCPNFLATCEFCKKEFPRELLIKHKDPNGVDICEKLVTLCPFKAVGCKESKEHEQQCSLFLIERQNLCKEFLRRQLMSPMMYEDRIERLENETNLQKDWIKHLEEQQVVHHQTSLSQVNELESRMNHLQEQVGHIASEQINPQCIADTISCFDAANVKNAEYHKKVDILCHQNRQYNEQCKLQEHEKQKCMPVPATFPIQEEVHNDRESSTDILVSMALAIENNSFARKYADATSGKVSLYSLPFSTHIAELLTKNTSKVEEDIRKLEHRLEEQENVIAGIRNLAADGILVWKIDQVARKRADATSGRQVSFYSPPFYTDPHGYKMCARIYLNGDGMGKGNHISLFSVIMRGEYDPLLKWPFRQKVTMMLLDQDNEEHVIDAFRPDPSSSSFQKPRGAMNIASGCQMFCPHSELQRHAYIRDDVMFIKIIVDRSAAYDGHSNEG